MAQLKEDKTSVTCAYDDDGNGNSDMMMMMVCTTTTTATTSTAVATVTTTTTITTTITTTTTIIITTTFYVQLFIHLTPSFSSWHYIRFPIIYSVQPVILILSLHIAKPMQLSICYHYFHNALTSSPHPRICWLIPHNNFVLYIHLTMFLLES